MVSKIAILAAAVMAVSIGSTVSASARHGGMMGRRGNVLAAQYAVERRC